MVPVLVAKQPLRAGPFPEQCFELRSMLQNELPRNALTDVNQVRHMLLVRPLKEGEPCSADDFVPVPRLVTRRAVTVRIKRALSLYPEFAPAAHVDVFGRVRPEDKRWGYKDTTLVSDVLLLNADAEPDPMYSDGGKVSLADAHFVTLALTPHQAEILTRAYNHYDLLVVSHQP
jgi:Flp pilus assembly protein CpaB